MFTQHWIVLRHSENHTRYSLRSRCLEVVGARKNERPRGRHAFPRDSIASHARLESRDCEAISGFFLTN